MKDKNIKNNKEKKIITPNECSTERWLAALTVGMLIGVIGAIPFEPYLENRVDTIMGITYADFFGMLHFIPLFVGAAVALWLLAKTSLKDFILGVGGKVNKKACLIITGLYAIGFAIPILSTVSNIHLRGVKAEHFAFLVVFMVLTTWVQTTWEELIFRGFAIRYVCKNNVGYTKRSLVAAVISSLIFALMHIANPEVTSQSGINTLIAVLSYSIPGIVFCLADLHFGNLLPGIIMHWLNNFLSFTIISSDTSVLPVPTLFLDTTPKNAVLILISNLVTCLPVMVYILVDSIKQKRKVSAPLQ